MICKRLLMMTMTNFIPDQRGYANVARIYSDIQGIDFSWRIVSSRLDSTKLHQFIKLMSSYIFYICLIPIKAWSLQWRDNERDDVSNHQPHDCLLNGLFRHRSKKISKLRVTGLCEGNSPVISEFPARRDSNAENITIWWRHHDGVYTYCVWPNSIS